MRKTALWLCIFSQMGLNLTTVESKEFAGGMADTFDIFYMQIRKWSLAANHLTALTADSLCNF